MPRLQRSPYVPQATYPAPRRARCIRHATRHPWHPILQLWVGYPSNGTGICKSNGLGGLIAISRQTSQQRQHGPQCLSPRRQQQHTQTGDSVGWDGQTARQTHEAQLQTQRSVSAVMSASARATGGMEDGGSSVYFCVIKVCKRKYMYRIHARGGELSPPCDVPEYFTPAQIPHDALLCTFPPQLCTPDA